MNSNVNENPDPVVIGAHGVFPNEKTLASFEEGGADVWVLAANPKFNDQYLKVSELLERLDAYSSRIALAKTLDDIVNNIKNGKISLIYGWMSAGPLSLDSGNDWRSKPPETLLRMWYELGLRVVGLTYTLSNQFAGGCFEDDFGLTRSGRHLVEKMQEMGVIVDVGGTKSERASLDALKIAQRPMCCISSNVSALNDNLRNTSDRVIEGIAETGGVFCVSAISDFMMRSAKNAGQSVPRASLSRLIDEFDYLKKLVGVDFFALGSDFTEGLNFSIDPKSSFIWPPEVFGPQTPLIYASGFEAVKDLPNLRKAMLERGWNTDEINKVFGGNWMRMLKVAWNA